MRLLGPGVDPPGRVPAVDVDDLIFDFRLTSQPRGEQGGGWNETRD